ncbi:MAG: hypothetical protein J0H60_16820 [Rhizobiales bacterium]|jgi:hypothetical protein|nr:hypothetical protein [Hyphomicrobiales bacterium]
MTNAAHPVDQDIGSTASDQAAKDFRAEKAIFGKQADVGSMLDASLRSVFRHFTKTRLSLPPCPIQKGFINFASKIARRR